MKQTQTSCTVLECTKWQRSDYRWPMITTHYAEVSLEWRPWISRRPQCPVTRPFAQWFVQADIKENPKFAQRILFKGKPLATDGLHSQGHNYGENSPLSFCDYVTTLFPYSWPLIPINHFFALINACIFIFVDLKSELVAIFRTRHLDINKCAWLSSSVKR